MAAGKIEEADMAEGALDGDASGSAMQRAVVAEQDARRAIADAERAAQKDVEQARARARAILSAVPDRIARLRVRGANAVRKAIGAIEAEEAEALRALGDSAFPADLLEPATQALAEDLTGGRKTDNTETPP